MRYCPASFNNLPLTLIFLPDIASVAVSVDGMFVPFVDSCVEPAALFDVDGFTMEGKKYEYNATYRCNEHPSVVKWIQQQQLILGPVVKFEMTVTKERGNE